MVSIKSMVTRESDSCDAPWSLFETIATICDGPGIQDMDDSSSVRTQPRKSPMFAASPDPRDCRSPWQGLPGPAGPASRSLLISLDPELPIVESGGHNMVTTWSQHHAAPSPVV